MYPLLQFLVNDNMECVDEQMTSILGQKQS